MGHEARRRSGLPCHRMRGTGRESGVEMQADYAYVLDLSRTGEIVRVRVLREPRPTPSKPPGCRSRTTPPLRFFLARYRQRCHR